MSNAITRYLNQTNLDQTSQGIAPPTNFQKPPKSNAISRYLGEQEESAGKNALRTGLQIPQGVLEATPYGIATGLWGLLGLGETLDPQEIEHIRNISEREGVPFNEEAYLQAAQGASESIPTISNLGREFESFTGLPLEPKTRLQKGLRFASTAAKIAPKPSAEIPKGYTFRGMNTGLPRPILGAGVEGVREVLLEMGIPETIADIAAFGILKPTTESSGLFKIGKASKESGLTERRYENLKKPRQVSESTINKINQKVETEVRDITNQIIEKSPIKDTHTALANDASFKSNVREGFKKVKELSKQFTDVEESSTIKNNLTDLVDKSKKEGLTLLEFEKAKNNFIEEFIQNTPDKQFKASDLVQQYRDNNTALSQAYEPGKSFAYNRAKREALLEYNRLIAKLIENKYPNTEFAKLFNETNQRWTQIVDSETISKFLDTVFNEKTDFRHVKKLFDKEGMNVPFKRAMGEEGFARFERLLSDLLSTEQANKLLKVAKSSGMGDLVKTIGAYATHPHIAKAKFGFDVLKGGYNKIYDMLLDTPKLSITWDRGLNALKKGDLKAAQKEFAKVQQADEVLTAREASRRAALKKFMEGKNKSNPAEAKTSSPISPENTKAQVNPAEKISKPAPKLIEYKPKSTPVQTQKRIAQANTTPKLIEYKPSKKPSLKEKTYDVAKFAFDEKTSGKTLSPIQKEALKETQVSILNTRNKGQQFHGSKNKINKLNEDIFSSSSDQNIYGPGFYSTDALDIANGYSKARGSKNPSVYSVREIKNQKLYDAEQPIDHFKMLWDDRKEKYFLHDKKNNPNKYKNITLEQYKKDSDYLIDNILYEENPKSLREVYDKIGEFAKDEGIPAYEAQDYFVDIMNILEDQGFEGISHTGGLRTNNPSHQVKIYWKPENLEISPFYYPKEFVKSNKIYGKTEKPSIKTETKNPNEVMDRLVPPKSKTPNKNPLIDANDDVKWYLGQEKRPFATSTKAISDGIEALINEGDTFNDLYKKINYEPKGKAIIKHFIDGGYGDTQIPLTKDGRIAPLSTAKKRAIGKIASKNPNEVMDRLVPPKSKSPKKTPLQEYKDLEAPLKKARQTQDKAAIDKISKRRDELLENEEVLKYVTTPKELSELQMAKKSRTPSMSETFPKPTKGELVYTPPNGKTIRRPADVYDGIFSISKQDGYYVVSHLPTAGEIAAFKLKKSAVQFMKELFEENLIDARYVNEKTMEKAGPMIKDRNDLMERIRKYR